MKPLLVPGGRAFVWPAVQRVQRYVVDLFSSSSIIHINSTNGYACSYNF